ncbi:MAG: hypothetical protein CMA64_09740 [Euryarchaeota archaeon]|nr:hypothetical protein [Euryarchaeota archaeon]
MASLAEIRARLQAQETRQSGSNTGGDNAIFPHWNIQENESTTLRFLPDGDSSNTFFWAERQMIRLPFQGIKGQVDSKPVTVQVPCMEMWEPVGSCPILSEVRPWFKDSSLEDMGRKYWKKRSYVFQGFVRENPLTEDSTPENPIRRFIMGPQLFNIIKASLMDPEMEELPTDSTAGLDFRVTKTTKGGYADYSTSKWARKESPLSEAEQSAIDKHGLYTLNDFLPKKPSEAELNIIKQMFEESVDGKPYDTEKYGAYYRPAGVSAPQGTTTTTATTSPAPAVEQPVVATTTETVAPAPTPTAEPIQTEPAPAQPVESTSAKRADDILAMIRDRQQK